MNDKFVFKVNIFSLMNPSCALSAFNENPARFNHKKPQQKILLPVYINPPQTVKIKNDEKNHGQQEVIVA